MISILDGHNDLLMRLHLYEQGNERIFFSHGDRGAIDLPRAREGGFAGGFFAVYLPEEPEKRVEGDDDRIVIGNGYRYPLAEPIGFAYAQRTAMSMIATLFRLESESDGALKVVRSVDELNDCLRRNVLAAILHFEGAEAIDTELDALEVFYRAGLRSLGIVWSRPNAFGHGVPFEFPHSPDTGPGLTDAGKDLVRACNRLGIMIDLAHLNERGFWDVAALSDAPLVATHTAVHALCPSTRNLTDRQIDAIGESNGVIGMNFHVSDLRADGARDADTPIGRLVDHIDYLAKRIGIDHIAFGSDFDGATMPATLDDVSKLPNLVSTLRERGYGEADIRRMAHENWIRLLGATWKEVPI